MSTSQTAAEPVIREMGPARVAVVRTTGDPSKVGPMAIAALFGAVVPVGAPQARWPNAHLAPRTEWIGEWAVPIAPDARPRFVPGQAALAIETWPYGTVAELLHIGPFETEAASVERLHRFISDAGYEIAGPHEEEYQSMPGADEQRTLIRYVVRRRATP